MVGYRLTTRAAQDFEDIFVYGAVTFGVERAESYAAGLEARFEHLVEHPRLYQAVDDIRSGYRRSVYGSHAIYDQIVDDKQILIVRILRGQELGTALR
ncbi:type II toxin-antitoxin system RelE/ParE family toxin [Thiocystis violacea]|uniref:type II toxin-antitoxin system RelE/ParE family toxin n=1 Tax=Thiocystis violacea TaxID=13725 RepID=UPI0019034BB6|nr:type II toxin-antitoxin system RelE/ParE family toxin [Thiocystis violacea]MBK1722981.1 hypothetical protein [Thiocystis violacea]